MNNFLRTLTFCVIALLSAVSVKAQGDVTAKWDFKNDLPAGIQETTNYQKTTVDIPSTVEGVSMPPTANSIVSAETTHSSTVARFCRCR